MRLVAPLPRREELVEAVERAVAEHARGLLDREDGLSPEQLVEPEPALRHELGGPRPVPVDHSRRIVAERSRVDLVEGCGGHDVEVVEAALGLVLEREADGLRDVAVVDAAEEQAEAVALEGLGHEHPEPERDGGGPSGASVVARELLAQPLGEAVDVCGKGVGLLGHDGPALRSLGPAVDPHRARQDDLANAGRARRLVDVERPGDVRRPEVGGLALAQVDAVERRGVHDGIDALDGTLERRAVAHVRLDGLVLELERTGVQRQDGVPMLGPQRDRGAPEIAAGASDQDLHGAACAPHVGPRTTGLPSCHTSRSSQSCRPGGSTPTAPLRQAW